MNESAQEYKKNSHRKDATQKQLETLRDTIELLQNSDNGRISGNDVLDLFMNLFGQNDWKEQGKIEDCDVDSDTSGDNNTSFKAPPAIVKSSKVFLDNIEDDVTYDRPHKNHIMKESSADSSTSQLSASVDLNKMVIDNQTVTDDYDEDDGNSRRKMVKQSLSRNRTINSHNYLENALLLLNKVSTRRSRY